MATIPGQKKIGAVNRKIKRRIVGLPQATKQAVVTGGNNALDAWYEALPDNYKAKIPKPKPVTLPLKGNKLPRPISVPRRVKKRLDNRLKNAR